MPYHVTPFGGTTGKHEDDLCTPRAAGELILGDACSIKLALSESSKFRNFSDFGDFYDLKREGDCGRCQSEDLGETHVDDLI